ncbi:hypothetical protein BRC81_12730 [Halobacteriales archaeon QS_1_68_20]|nr:MAG: hypothetical protein BRC81_12730 [Halobacteriales archaeon QS_1_68_20]
MQPGLVVMLARGLWAALANVATRTIPPEVAMIVSYLTGVAVFGETLSLRDAAGVGFAVLAVALLTL